MAPIKAAGAIMRNLIVALFSLAVAPSTIERPKHIFPSHVYQIAGMLQDELARLEDQM